MTSAISSVKDTIQFCIDVILKEAREETRLVKQILYVLLSMYTNNPINLAINAPTGEGKNYVIKKVGELFPANDVIYLAGLSEKALYHRHGILVVKDPQTGKYDSIEDRLKQIDEQIEYKEVEIYNASNNTLKQSLKHDIKDLLKQKNHLIKDARNLIDLSHKTLVLLDTPSKGLFGALMSLLSHDQYEAEYEFADTTNTGISTKTNVVRGWPAVIFAQAVDYSNYSRWSEVQRRFIITNPNMDPTKYNAAIDLMADKFGIPDFAYQARVVSREDKDAARDMIVEIKQSVLELTRRSTEAGENNVIVPFITPLNKSLARQKAADMTMGYRIFSFLSLLPQINFYSRPYMQVIDPSRNILYIQTIPFALFEDLKEAAYLMEYADGVRPYVLIWYHQVFLPTFNAMTRPNSRTNSKGDLLVEKAIAVTTKQLATATEYIQNKLMSPKQILENYIEPLINQGYIDKIDSELDRRTDVYYPIILKVSKLFDSDQSNNFLQDSRIAVLDPTIFPDKTYVKTSILNVCNYSISKGLQYKIISPDKKNMSIDELVDQHYADAENYFSLKTQSEIEYMQSGENRVKSQGNPEDNIESITSETKPSEKLFDLDQSNNLSIFPNEPDKNVQLTCPKCGIKLDPFYGRIHIEQCDGTRD